MGPAPRSSPHASSAIVPSTAAVSGMRRMSYADHLALERQTEAPALYRNLPDE